MYFKAKRKTSFKDYFFIASMHFKYLGSMENNRVQKRFRKPIRVLYVNHTAKLGGGELALSSMLRHLDASRVHAQVLLLEEGPLVKDIHPETQVHLLPLTSDVLETRKDSLGRVSRKQLQTLLALPGYVLAIRRVISRLDIDIVHTNSLKADILGGIAARMAGKRVLWHVRDRIASDYLPANVVRVFRRLARVIPNAVVANSHATMETLHLPRKASSRVVHDGFDFATLPAKALAPDGVVRVSLVGRISSWKGQEIFLRAIQQVHQDFPDVVFQIAGAPLFGEEKLEQELHALSRELGIADRVEFLGFVSQMRAYMAKLSVLVHASTLDEPFGQVVIEGMAAGVPVIATRGGGVSEIVEDGISGVLVPKREPTALAAAMRDLLTNPGRRQQLGGQGRARVQQHFRIESTAEKMMDVYESLVSS